MLMAMLLATALAGCATPAPPRGSKPGAAKPGAIAPVAAKQGNRAQAGAGVTGARRHLVQAGDTGLALARTYGVPWGRIAAANGLDREAVIRVGQTLIIPPASGTEARPAGPPAGRSAGRTPGRTPGRTSAPSPHQTFETDMADVISGSSVAAGATARPAPPPGQSAASPPPGQPAAPAPPAIAVPPLAWPVDGRVLLSDFGPKPGGRVNDGINIKALRGGTVRAAADGEVIYVGDAIQGFGLLMLIRHAGGYVTAYGHLEGAVAARGDKVQRGQPIARAGSSGEAREPQLLFQVRQGRKPLNPMLYLPK